MKTQLPAGRRGLFSDLSLDRPDLERKRPEKRAEKKRSLDAEKLLNEDILSQKEVFLHYCSLFLTS